MIFISFSERKLFWAGANGYQQYILWNWHEKIEWLRQGHGATGLFLKLDIIGFRRNDVTIALHFRLKEKWITNHGWVTMTTTNVTSVTNGQLDCLNSIGLGMVSPRLVQNPITVLTMPTHLKINILLKGFKSLWTLYKNKFKTTFYTLLIILWSASCPFLFIFIK